MKKLYIFLCAIVIIAVAIVLYMTLYHPSEPVKAFTDSTGSYSFEYPAAISELETKGTIDLFVNIPSGEKSLAVVVPFYYPDFLNYERNTAKASVVQTVLGSVSAYKINKFGTQPLSGYVIPLDDGDKPSDFIMVLKYGDDSYGFTEKQTEALVASLKIDKTKAMVLAQKAAQAARTQGIEARLRSDLSQIRVSMENYFTKNTGYAGLCAPSDSHPDIRDLFADITQNAGPSSMTCHAQKASYAVSIRLPSGPITCVDSSGFLGDIAAIITGPSCK